MDPSSPVHKPTSHNEGISEDDKESYSAIREAYTWGSICNIRNLFAAILLSGSLSQPRQIWEKTWHMLSGDILQRQRDLLQNLDLNMTDDELKHHALNDIERILQTNGTSLRNFYGMPIPRAILSTHKQNDLSNESSDDKKELTYEHTILISSMNMEQMSVYDEIMESVHRDCGGVFFIYGHAGTGKTFILRALCAALRSKGEIVIPVASSGIAAALLPGGRAGHDVFGIPLDVSENSTCKYINQGSRLDEHLRKTKLIIWDEAPMMHRYCIEALDRSLKDLMQTSSERGTKKPFGGKLVVFAGDFRQLLPLFTDEDRGEVVRSTINSSYLWSECKMLHLTRNMRLDLGTLDIKVQEMREFDQWIKKVGEGTLEEMSGGKSNLYIPDDVLIKDTTEPLASIVQSTYSCLKDNLCNIEYFHERAILAPTQKIADTVNQYTLSLLPGKVKIYLSSNQLQREESKEENITIQLLKTMNGHNLLPNSIGLKIGAIVMLLKTIDKSVGMCNGTRLMVTNLGDHIIRATIISGSNIGVQVYIPRITMTPSSSSKFPVKFVRKQFPLAISFAMTIHKAQAQSLTHVGLYLPKPVVGHGHLYLAISRVTSKKGLKIFISDKDGMISNATTNVVFREIFKSLC